MFFYVCDVLLNVLDYVTVTRWIILVSTTSIGSVIQGPVLCISIYISHYRIYSKFNFDMCLKVF